MHRVSVSRVYDFIYHNLSRFFRESHREHKGLKGKLYKKSVQQIHLQVKPFQKFATFGKVFHDEKVNL
jgi:hypothetical protein